MLDPLRRLWSNIIDLVRKFWSVQILRFFAVGGVNTAFGYGVFALFIWFGLPEELAALLGTICGVLFNFKTYGTIVFKNKNARLILRFFGVYLVTYLLAIGLLRIFKHYGISSLVAYAIIILPIALLSFWLNKRFVFRAVGENTE
jgi:putative flippase GtrA